LQNPDIDGILEEIGAVGPYQVFYFLVILSGMIAGAFILYSLYYFDLQPDYLCIFKGQEAQGWQSCKQKDICVKDQVRDTIASYEIDYSS